MINKKIKIAAGVIGTIFVAFLCATVGAAIVELDIKKKILKGELVIESGRLVFASSVEKNKDIPQDEKTGGDLIEQVPAQQKNTDGEEQYREEAENEKRAIMRAGNDIITPYVKEKIKNIDNYTKLESTGGYEFLDKDFADTWPDQYKEENAVKFSDAKRLKKEIENGDIYYQEFHRQIVYYAPNYFNWTKERIKGAMDVLCDGIDCNVPRIIEASERGLFWSNIGPCSGGMRQETVIPEEEFYGQYICNFLTNAIGPE